MQTQLPFDDLAEPPATDGGKRSRQERIAPRAASRAAQPDRHLRAAWRLSRSMGRYRRGSEEQTRAGLAICRHLQALLNDPR